MVLTMSSLSRAAAVIILNGRSLTSVGSQLRTIDNNNRNVVVYASFCFVAKRRSGVNVVIDVVNKR